MTIGKAEKPIIGRCEDVGFGKLGARDVERVEVPKAERHERAGASHQVVRPGVGECRRGLEPGRYAVCAPGNRVLGILDVVGAAVNKGDALGRGGEKLEDSIRLQPDS